MLKKFYKLVSTLLGGFDSGRPVPTVVGASIRIKGEMQGEEDVVVAGHVDGDVSLGDHEFTLKPEGKVEATVHAGQINVGGHVEGNLWGTIRVVVDESASVQGNIIAPRVVLEDGCKFKGTIDMNPEDGILHTLVPKKVSDSESAEKPH